MPSCGTQCCFYLNGAVLSVSEFGCISTTLCYGISFGTSLGDTLYQPASLFTILVHIRFLALCLWAADPLFTCYFFYQSMRCKVQMPYVPFIWS